MGKPTLVGSVFFLNYEIVTFIHNKIQLNTTLLGKWLNREVVAFNTKKNNIDF